jgi:hypothetical protein
VTCIRKTIAVPLWHCLPGLRHFGMGLGPLVSGLFDNWRWGFLGPSNHGYDPGCRLYNLLQRDEGKRSP